MINQNNDAAISDTDLDKVSGGFFGVIYQTFQKVQQNQGGGGGCGGGQNDPAQMFQQILQQLTGPQ